MEVQSQEGLLVVIQVQRGKNGGGVSRRGFFPLRDHAATNFNICGTENLTL